MRMLKILALILTLVSYVPLAWSFAEEDRDWGVPPTMELRQPPYSAPTPTEIPGAKPVTTGELHDMLILAPTPVLIDVASGDGHLTLRGAYWIPGAGRGTHFLDPLQAQLAEYLEKLSNGDKNRPLVFFCVNARCWLSYNASLRASALGYRRVYWYRGGIEAWRDADLPLSSVSIPSTATPVTASDR